MIIISHTEPGYSNQLFQNAFALAYARKKNRLFFNCSDISWRKYYKGGGSRFLTGLISIFSKYRYKIPIIFQNIFKIGYVNMDSYETMQKKIDDISNYKITFMSGWYFHIPLSDQRKYFQLHYSLKKKYYENNGLYKNIMHFKSKGYIIVGVHARRGDYKHYEGGAYFYDWCVYKQKILEVQNLLQETNNIKFVIFSNDSVPKFLLSNDIIVSTEQWYLDHHLMGLCNYLFGPPSTFSLWASFIGGVKYCPLNNPNENMTISDFKEYESPLC